MDSFKHIVTQMAFVQFCVLSSDVNVKKAFVTRKTWNREEQDIIESRRYTYQNILHFIYVHTNSVKKIVFKTS